MSSLFFAGSLAFPSAADAKFQVLGTADLQPVEPYQSWADESRIPLPGDDHVTFSNDVWACPEGRYGCLDGNTIRLAADGVLLRREAFLHELGHYITDAYVEKGYRRSFCRVTGLHCSSWFDSSGATPTVGSAPTWEHAADTFRLIAQYGTYGEFQAAGDAARLDFTYGWWPGGPVTWTRVNKIIRAATRPYR